MFGTMEPSLMPQDRRPAEYICAAASSNLQFRSGELSTKLFPTCGGHSISYLAVAQEDLITELDGLLGPLATRFTETFFSSDLINELIHQSHDE